MQPLDPYAALEYFARKVAYSTGPVEVDAMLRRGERFTLVDVRYPASYLQGHLPGAINLPKGGWDAPVGLRRDRPNVLYCHSATCRLAAEAAVALAARGWPVVHMDGGYDAWVAQRLPVQA